MLGWLTLVALASPDDIDARLKTLEAQIAQQEAELAALRARQGEEASSLPPLDGPVAAARVQFGDVEIATGETVEEVVSVGGDVLVRGAVAGDAVSIFGDVRVTPSGRVDGDVVSVGGEVMVDGAVDGDRVSLGVDPPPAPLDAGVDRHATGSMIASSSAATVEWLYHRVVWMLTIAGSSVLVIGLAPDRVGRVAASLERSPVRSALVGVLGSGSLVAFALLLVAMTVGLASPVALGILVALLVAWLMGFVAFCQSMGDRLPVASRVHGRWISLAAGVVVLGFSSLLPWVGWLAIMVISMIGVGASLSTRFGSRS
jgi:hypothetical protein